MPSACAELVVELASPLVHVRLVDGDQRARPELAGRTKRSRDLGRVVPVVVDTRDSTAIADELEPATHAGERRERPLSGRAVHPRGIEHGERRRSVGAVVLARHAQLESDGLELPSPNHLRRVCEPLLEEGRQLRLGRVRRVMVELDVRHGGDLGSKERDRAVGLVALDDEPALPHACVSAELWNDSADDPRGIVAELAKDVRDHRSCRRLAVGAADDDRATERDELREELCARAPLDATRVRRRDDDLEAGRRSGLAAEIDVHAFHRLEEDRVAHVPAGDLRTPGAREVRVGGHARSADPDEVEAPTGEGQLVHRPASASAISSSATTSAASGLASARIASLMRASRSASPSSSSASSGTRASSL